MASSVHVIALAENKDSGNNICFPKLREISPRYMRPSIRITVPSSVNCLLEKSTTLIFEISSGIRKSA